EGLHQTFLDPPEVAEVVEWWGMRERIIPRTVPQFVEHMDAAGVDAVLVPSAKMNSYKTSQLIWDVSEEQVAEVAEQAPGRVYGLVGIDPREGMQGVRRLEHWVRNGPFVGAHLHP